MHIPAFPLFDQEVITKFIEVYVQVRVPWPAHLIRYVRTFPHSLQVPKPGLQSESYPKKTKKHKFAPTKCKCLKLGQQIQNHLDFSECEDKEC